MKMPEPCLALVPQRIWRREFGRLVRRMHLAIPGTADTRNFTRLSGSGRIDLELEVQGRVPLAESFREHAGLETGGDVAIIGAENRIEIWDRSRWETYRRKIESEYQAITERVRGEILGAEAPPAPPDRS
jgi:MraZ protein